MTRLLNFVDMSVFLAVTGVLTLILILILVFTTSANDIGLHKFLRWTGVVTVVLVYTLLAAHWIWTLNEADALAEHRTETREGIVEAVVEDMNGVSYTLDDGTIVTAGDNRRYLAGDAVIYDVRPVYEVKLYNRIVEAGEAYSGMAVRAE